MQMEPLPHIILDGKTVPSGDAKERLSSRLAMYGEGCFDTIRSYNGGFLYPEKHLHRLHKGMIFLGWNIPEPLCDARSFMEILGLFLRSNGSVNQHVRIRIQVWANNHGTGYNPVSGNLTKAEDENTEDSDRVCKQTVDKPVVSKQTVGKQTVSKSTVENPVLDSESMDKQTQSGQTTRFIITGHRMNPIAGRTQTVSLATSRYRRIPADALPPEVKWTNGINYILAAKEAHEKGVDDALMLTTSGFVSETTVANIFWKKSDMVYTPSVDCDLLPGITRSILTDILKDSGIPLRQGRFQPATLHDADAAWICNSVREICPVICLDEHRYQSESPFLPEIVRLYENHKQERLQYVR